MKIWHVGAGSSPNDVNGVNYAVWAVAKAQVLLDHEVSLILENEPDEAARETAKSYGLDLREIPVSMFHFQKAKIKRLLADEPPQMVHFHSVFIPQQAILARNLQRAGIPFVITPHGGLAANILRRNQLKKRLYSRLIESPRFMRAAAVSVVMPKEIEEIRSFVPEFNRLIRFVPNPVDDELFDKNSPQIEFGRKRVVYLGRFDIEHKGIDILLEIAGHLPKTDFHLYGAEDANTRRELNFLKASRSSNVYFHQPVYGAKKIEVLENADLYLQTSRWEAFGISIAEAMAIGLPCAVAEKMHIAELVRREKTGIILSDNPKAAAEEILNLLNDKETWSDYSAKAKKFALENFTSKGVAAKYIDFYTDVIQNNQQADKYNKVFNKSRKFKSKYLSSVRTADAKNIFLK